MMRRILPFLWAMCVGIGMMAQEITFNAAVDRTSVATGEPIKLTLTLSNAPMNSSIAPPDMGGLVVVQGPFDQNSFSMINGRTSSSVARTYYLQATKPGAYVIGPATARVAGGTINTASIRITVVKGESGTASSAAAGQGQQKDPNLFCTISLSKNKAYVGEQVLATYTLYSRYNRLDAGDYDLPKLDGFWAEEIDLGETSWAPAPQTVNGIAYRVAVLKKQLLIPQRSGQLRIAPMKMEFRVNAGFFSNGTLVSITSNAETINVLDLPTKPEDFIGAVGDLNMEVTVAATTVKANEPIDLGIKFNGRANLKLIDTPKLTFPSDFETYDPKVTDHITVNSGGMTGGRDYQFLLIPRHEGDYTVGPLSFSYFDPASGQYKRLTHEALSFHVEKGDGSAVGISGPIRNDVQELHRDIRYIRTGDLSLEAKGAHLFGSGAWTAGMVAPALAFTGLLLYRRRREKLLGDTSGMRRKGADRVAKKRLKDAATALQKNDREGFYTALGKALEGYFADRFDLGVAEVTPEKITEKLGHLEDGTLAREYTELMADSGMARFAPIEGKGRQQCYDEATSLIKRIEAAL
ncbi:MAG: BatD family protein [Flavobacteriales bacterium]